MYTRNSINGVFYLVFFLFEKNIVNLLNINLYLYLFFNVYNM